MKDHEFTDIIRNCIFPMLDDLNFCRKPQRSERERDSFKKADFPVFFPTRPIPARSATSSASQLPATFD